MSGPGRGRRRRPAAGRWLLAAGALAFAASVAGFAAYVTLAAPGWATAQVDLQVYRAGGLVARHVSPAFSPRFAAPLYGWTGPPGLPLKFTYPPFAAAVFAPVSMVPWAAAQPLSVAVNVALLLASVWFAFRGLGWRNGPARAGAALLVAAVVLWSEPVLRTIYLGQVNLALMALILWDLSGPTAGARRWWRGAGVGIAAGIKLVPLIFVLYLLLTRRFRQAAVAGAAFLATVAAGYAVLPADSERWWLRGLFFHGSRTGFLAWEGNQSLRGLVARLAGDVAGSKPLWLVTAAGLGAAGLVCAAALHRAGHPMAGVLACALTGLLVSPVSWDHHWVWAAPAAAVAAGYAAAAWRGSRAAASGWRERLWPAAGYAGLAAALCVVYAAWPAGLWTRAVESRPFALGLIWVPPNTDPIAYFRLGDRSWFPEYHWHGLQLISGNAYVLGGLALFALLCAAAFRAARAAPAADCREGSRPAGVGGQPRAHRLPLPAMNTDSRPSGAPEARPASLAPAKPSLDGLEEKWSRRWEEAAVVQV